nr:hypothetical protein [Tanacetum cinerariifolium]
MVAYLNKSDARKGFNQVIDFFNGSYIQYALTVNPTIYVSCIKQFWNTVVIKQSNDVTRLQALVERKKVVFTKAAIRDVLCLDDVEGNQLGDFSTHTTKYISPALTQKVFANMMRLGKGFSRVETPLFEGMLVAREPEEQGDAEEQVQDNVDGAAQGADTTVSGDDHLEHDKVAQDLEITKLKTRVKKLERANKVKALKLRRLKKVGTSLRIESSADTDMEDASNQGRMIADLDRDEGIALIDDEGAKKKDEDTQVAGDEQVKGKQAKIYQIDMDHASEVLSMQEDEPEVQEVVEVVTTAKLITEVVAAVSESVSATSTTIIAVPAAIITAAPVRVVAASTKRRKGVVIRNPKEESTAKTYVETKSKDKGKGIMVEEPKPMKKKL